MLAQLDDVRIFWNVVDVVSEPNFDSSSSLTEGLWGSLKQKISIPLAHLLITSDVWRVTDSATMSLWCDFVVENYPKWLMLLNSSDRTIHIPIGFHFCSQPFGRLLVSFDSHPGFNQEAKLNAPLNWLLHRIGNYSNEVDLRRVCNLHITFIIINNDLDNI